MINYLNKFNDEMKLRNYSISTINIYYSMIKKYIEFVQKNNIRPKERIRQFILTFSSMESRKHAYSAIKLFYKLILNRDCPFCLSRVKQRKRLPGILNKNEILKILSVIKNKKHKLAISMLYGSGLRVSEVTKIQVCDLDLEKKLLLVKNAKGMKDRYTIISNKLIHDLNDEISGKGANEYLLQTISKCKYSSRTIQFIFQKALEKSGIKKKATCHTLRHSFATHLLNNGIDVRRIKSLLGHKSIRTTIIYLHLTDLDEENIQSPL